MNASIIRFLYTCASVLAVLGTSYGLAQGTLTFLNTPAATGTPGGAPVSDVDGATRLAGDGFFAQLYASPIDDEGSLFPIGVPVPFRTGAAAGFVVASQVAVPGSPRLSYVFIQMRAWDNAGGTALSYESALTSGLRIGKSNTIQVGPLGPLGPLTLDPDLAGLQPFSLIPEPSATWLALAGALVVAAFRLRRSPKHPFPLGQRALVATPSDGSFRPVRSGRLRGWRRTMRVMLVSVCLATSHAIAQGTLTFWNAPTATLTPEGAPVTDIDGATRLAGAGFFAQLYASPVNDEGSLFPIGVPVPFRTGLAAGFVVSSQVAVPGSPAVTYAFVQMRAWENLGGSAATYEAALASGLKSGKSNIIQVGPLGGICFGCPIIDPTLVGLQPFSLVPEPSITMLSLLGGLVIGAIGLVRKKPSLMVNPDEDMVLGKRTVSKVGDHNVA